ncbi:putative manganese-dependent inorganic diphosphatase [Geobacter hydrogenophilus]|uniref:inorganic diphosphatase n=1 Tax=Geobacter hydrogenophilus TaxID=40983 RepID=A0A9W6G170_9BACT|nr:putative manganese-dependent inorganic diphosphatase [Geobacter hydrogenophilus]MBT0894173.1 putative manganese-dependent inorganic diphosphatase [Geobacter hydrogenophilus]GLI38544.1 manganese-dependent inorganic pyrophosphatase [Geobacter hydrogenophilus]
MDKQVYVVGHRNPDTDSVAAALAYAALKNRQGQTNVTAAMAGEPNPQTRYILERLGIEPPVYLADVHPKVCHVINRQPVTAVSSTPLRDALGIFHKHGIRVLPVVDEGGAPLGLVSLLKLSEKYLVAGSDRKRGVDASLRTLASCLDGTFLTGAPTDEVEHLHLFIGAMLEESFSSRIEGYDPASLLIMTGDRRSIQQAAIERGVRLLVVTGGFPLAEGLRARAREQGVTVISTPHDTATAAGLARLSTPLSHFVEARFEKIGVAEPLEHLRLKLLHSGEPAVIAVEEDGTIAGVATKSSLLAEIPYSLILVDHNELAQSVPGAEVVEILEVIDHHKLGNPPTNQPITFMAAPVGSTCTVVASLYRERGIEPDQKMAALLLAGVLSDTVILKSPTTTSRDREIVLWLEERAGLDHVAFGKDIFSACGGFSAHGTPEKAIRADFKHFTAGDTLFGVGQVEVVGFDEFFDLKETLRETLKKVKEADRLHLAGLMVTDIYSETTLFLAEGKNELAHIMGYPQVEPHLYELKGVMSRKKQMVPHLLKVLGKL